MQKNIAGYLKYLKVSEINGYVKQAAELRQKRLKYLKL